MEDHFAANKSGGCPHCRQRYKPKEIRNIYASCIIPAVDSSELVDTKEKLMQEREMRLAKENELAELRMQLIVLREQQKEWQTQKQGKSGPVLGQSAMSIPGGIERHSSVGNDVRKRMMVSDPICLPWEAVPSSDCRHQTLHETSASLFHVVRSGEQSWGVRRVLVDDPRHVRCHMLHARPIRGLVAGVRGSAFSNVIATVSSDCSLQLWSTHTEQPVLHHHLQSIRPWSLAFDPSSPHRLAVGGLNGDVVLLDLRKVSDHASISKRPGLSNRPVHSLAFLPAARGEKTGLVVASIGGCVYHRDVEGCDSSHSADTMDSLPNSAGCISMEVDLFSRNVLLTQRGASTQAPSDSDSKAATPVHHSIVTLTQSDTFHPAAIIEGLSIREYLPRSTIFSAAEIAYNRVHVASSSDESLNSVFLWQVSESESQSESESDLESEVVAKKETDTPSYSVHLQGELPVSQDPALSVYGFVLNSRTYLSALRLRMLEIYPLYTK